MSRTLIFFILASFLRFARIAEAYGNGAGRCSVAGGVPAAMATSPRQNTTAGQAWVSPDYSLTLKYNDAVVTSYVPGMLHTLELSKTGPYSGKFIGLLLNSVRQSNAVTVATQAGSFVENVHFDNNGALGCEASVLTHTNNFEKDCSPAIGFQWNAPPAGNGDIRFDGIILAFEGADSSKANQRFYVISSLTVSELESTTSPTTTAAAATSTHSTTESATAPPDTTTAASATTPVTVATTSVMAVGDGTTSASVSSVGAGEIVAVSIGVLLPLLLVCVVVLALRARRGGDRRNRDTDMTVQEKSPRQSGHSPRRAHAAHSPRSPRSPRAHRAGSKDATDTPNHRSPRSNGAYDKAGTGVASKRARKKRHKSSSIEARFVLEANQLERKNKLGEGAFGLVYLGVVHGEKVAIKEIKEGVESEEARDEFIGEALQMQNLLPHKNVVLLYGICKDPLAIVQEFCALGALVDYLYGEKAADNAGVLSDDDTASVVCDIVCGLAHLHRNNIVHRDLAARNVLLTDKKVAKLADFGMARSHELDVVYQRTTTTIGPIKWMAPEQLAELKFSFKSDIWAFAVLLYEVFAREEPWPTTPITLVPVRVMKGERLDLGEKAPEAIKALAAQCWREEPAERPTAEDCMNRIQNVFVGDGDGETVASSSGPVSYGTTSLVDYGEADDQDGPYAPPKDGAYSAPPKPSHLEAQ